MPFLGTDCRRKHKECTSKVSVKNSHLLRSKYSRFIQRFLKLQTVCNFTDLRGEKLGADKNEVFRTKMKQNTSDFCTSV